MQRFWLIAFLVSASACSSTSIQRTLEAGAGAGGTGADDGGSDASTGGVGGSAGSAGSGGATGGAAGTAGAGGGAGGTGGATGGAGGTSATGGSSSLDGSSDTLIITSAGVTFSFTESSVQYSAELTYSFEVDRYEVSVGRFQAWVTAGQPVPCAGSGSCSLDAGGPLATGMLWDSAWNTEAQRGDHFDSASCNAPLNYGQTTYERADATLPMTCVSWYQAAAMCAFEGKRLLTEVEWMYLSGGHGASYAYSWGNTAPDCAHALYRSTSASGCGFPKPGGSAPAGASIDGLLDLTGSVHEWVWDTDWQGALPPTLSDWTGPIPSTTDAIHTRKGGAYINPDFTGDAALRNDHREAYPANEYYADAGFRCARSR